MIQRGLLIILIITSASCGNRHGVEFIIHNNSNIKIDSIRVSSSDKRTTIKFVNIEKGATKQEFLDMGEVVKADGNYIVELSTLGIAKNKSIGYYTNGYPSEEKIDIYFEGDTIKYKSKIKEY